MPFDRFYASLRPLRVECPACGVISQCSRRMPEYSFFNEATSRLKCRGCRRTFVLGIVAWTPNHGGATIPPDHKLTKRQLLQLRNQAGGFWNSENIGPYDNANVYLDDEPDEPEDR